MSIINQATDHFKSLSPGEIDVPEWKTKLTWSPLTLNDEAQIYAADNATGQPASPEKIFARTLISKAKGPDGKPAFDEMEENLLIHGVDSSVIKRVANKILGSSTQTKDVADKIESAKNV